MKKAKSTLVILLLLSIQSFSQNKVSFVKYKSLSSNKRLYNTWLQEDTIIYNYENVYSKMFKGFPVYDERGKSRKETDTVKYNKEYKENLILLEETISKYIFTSKRAYSSNIVHTYNQQPNLEKTYTTIDTLSTMDKWEILNDTCTIMNFKCQKATILYDSIKYFAWFTTKLPYNAGPEQFRGLPGLILKVFNKEESLGFEVIEIQSPSKNNLPLFKKGDIATTAEGFKRIVMEAWNKEMEALGNMKVGERQKLN
jgi:GLPGLI family protein